MPASWILESKLTPPAPPPDRLARRLLAPGEPLPPALLLQAGPGYGKTLALLALTESDADGVTLWYTLDDLDADPVTFFTHLAHGMRRHIPQFGTDLEALAKVPGVEPRRLWRCFFAAVVAFDLPALRLVLDDAHAWLEGGRPLLDGLVYFLDKLPPRTHVLLASRLRLPGPLARLEARGALRLLTQRELRFTAAEERRLLASRAPGGEPPDGWLRRAVEMEGWPLGIARIGTLAHAWPHERDDADPARLADYLASEVVEAQPPARQALMMQAALLREPTAEAIAAVFDAPGAHAQLTELEADQLLVRIGTGGGYRFPSYLASHLRQAADRAFPSETRAGWHRKAAAHYRAQRQPELALPHLLACGDWDAAAVTCRACFPAMRFAGRQAQLERWLGAFPPEVRDAHPWLLLWRGHLASARGHLGEASAFYERAQRTFAAEDDAAGAFKALVRRYTLAILRQDAREASRLSLQAMARVGEGLDEDVADLALTRALAADMRGDLALMRECNEAVLAVPVGEHVEIAASHWNAHMNLYTLWLLQGELGRADHHIAAAMAIAEAWGFHAYAIDAAFQRAHLRLAAADAETAEALVGGVSPVWEELLDWQGRACAHVVLGQLLQARGAFKEAEEAMRRAVSTYEAAGFLEGRKVPLHRLMWLALQRRQPARTDALLAEAGEPKDGSVYDLALLVPHGRSLHLRGRLEEAEALLTRAADGLRRLGAGLHLAQALQFLAAARAARGDDLEARAAYDEAARLTDERDYGFLRRQDQRLWEELAGLSVPPGGQAPVAEGAERGLRLRMLGPFELHVDGVRVDQWPRKKAKLLLAALALHPRGLTLGELLAFVGEPEVTPAIVSAWQVVVNALRRVLEPSLPKRTASRFVPLIGERYVLASEEIDYIDVRRFEEAASRADRLRAREPAGAATAYREALSHYRGDLLDQEAAVGGFEADREHRRQAAIAALAWLAGHHEARGEVDEAGRDLRRVVELAPAEEDGYLSLMRHGARHGDAALVRQAYWDCRKALKARLGVPPSDELEAAYHALVGGVVGR